MGTKLNKCKWCELSKTRTQVVMGAGSLHADLMFVGEAPGKNEDLEGKPFIGDAGDIFQMMLDTMKIKRKRIWVTNTCKCRPVEIVSGKVRNGKPTPTQAESCSPWLDLEIDRIKPKIIVPLGGTALYRMTKLTGISHHRGRFISIPDKDYKVFPMYHPAYILYRRYTRGFKKLKNEIHDDLMKLKKGYRACRKKRK